jgi:hypothetical protein
MKPAVEERTVTAPLTLGLLDLLVPGWETVVISRPKADRAATAKQSRKTAGEASRPGRKIHP